MQTGRLLLTLWICLLAGTALAKTQPHAAVPTTLRVIDGDRWLVLDQSARVEIPPTLLALQLTARQQKQIRRILDTESPGADPQKAVDAYLSIRKVLDRRQQRALVSHAQMWSANRQAVADQPRIDHDTGSGG